MPIRLPVLDDRTYADLSLELRALIPSYAPDWTDHNPSDPGITLLELFAWLAEGLLYRVDRVPEASTVRMLELLGAVFRPAQPATVVLRARLAGTGMPAAGLTLPAGARLTARPAGQDTLLPFETVDDVRLTPEWLEALVTARQVARTASEFLGRSNGQPHQRFSLLAAGAGAVFIEPTGSRGVRPCAPAVSVNGQAWEYRADLVHSGPEDRHFTVDTRRSLIRFGPGREDETRRAGPASDVQREGGAVPPAAAVIQADYCYTLGAGGNMPAGGMYALTDAQGAGGNLPTAIAWEAIGPATGGQGPTSLEDARAEVYRIINNAWRAITNEDFEQLVLGQASLHVARAKSLPEVEVAGSRRKGGARGLDQASSVGAGATRAGAAGTAEGEPELRPEAGHVSLMVFPQPTREPVAAITELDEEALSVREVEFSQDGQVLAVWLAPAEANRSVVGADRVWIWQAARAGAGQGSSPEPLPLPDEASVTSLALS
ncbi:MAG: hypothetical protein ACM30E_13290, partial [Nitrososphaerales archaeon]